MAIKVFNYVADGVHGSLPEDKEGIPFVSSKDIKNGIINLDTKLVNKNAALKHANRIKVFPNNILITNSGTIGEVAIIPNNISDFTLQKSVAVCEVSNKFIPKYVYYWFILNKNKLVKLGQGSAQKNILLKDLRLFTIENISLKIQEKIIDIIEPFEKMKINLSNQLMEFERMVNLTSWNYLIKNKLNENCNFIKGKNLDKKKELGKTLFLNVSAANGHFNKFCGMESNIFPKEITLSLDGNIGLVNNNLYGFNGYLYKICSCTIPNWQVYYSLKHKINQEIMKKNEVGTTIKHSPNSKKELLLLEFQKPELLKIIFDLEINVKNQITIIDNLIKKIINLLIK